MTFRIRKGKSSRALNLAAQKSSEEGPLREFVYLDEVSVRSLRASRVGALPAELRDMRSAVLAAEVSGTAAVTAPTVAKASIQSTLTSTRSGGTEILRKSIVQSDFKDLRDGELGRLKIGPVHQSVPAFHESMLESSNQWIVRGDRIERGALVELRVRLGASGIFKVGAVFDSLTTLLSRSKLDPATAKLLKDMAPMNETVQELLSGLVPIECTAVDYRVGEMQGQTWLVHEAMLESLPSLRSIRPLVLAATTRSSLYWQDLRQLLFSDLEFDILARVTKTGLSSFWSPVKLADVFRSFAPGAAQAVDNLDSLARRIMDSRDSDHLNDPIGPGKGSEVERKLLTFAALATADEEENVMATDFLERIAEVGSRHEGATTVSEMHHAYDEVCEVILETRGRSIPLEKRASLRAAANATTSIDSNVPTASAIPEVERAILETEVVAIYW